MSPLPDRPDRSEFLLYQSQDGRYRVQVRLQDDTVWLTQKQMAELFDKDVRTVNEHLQNIFEEGELEPNSVIRNFRITATDGKTYDVQHYNLDAVISVGYRARSHRGVQFRQWATQRLREFLIKGFVMDDERLKNPDGRPDYFDEMLARIRDIRASEKRFYQKVRELFTLSSDYDPSDRATLQFFAETQNKLLYAVTGQTAAELILARADAGEPNMGLTAWEGNIVRKKDILTAKNYLTEDEIDTLNRLVVIFLETAELRAKNRQDLTIAFWRENVDRILTSNDFSVLESKGSVSHKQMEGKVGERYAEFDARRKREEADEADRQDAADLRELESAEQALKGRKKEGGGA